MIRPTSFLTLRPVALAGAFCAAFALAPMTAGAQGAAAAKKPAAKADKASTSKDASKDKKATDKGAKDKTADKKPDAKKADAKKADDKPLKVATSGDWGAYTSGVGKAKTCYALAEPRERQPASLKRDKGYLFISDRPGESVRNEVAFDVGFDVKPDGPATADIGSASFDLVAKGSKLWVKNAAEEPQFIEALRKGQKLTVKALSKKGNASTDTYALGGAGQMIDRAAKDCQ